MRIPKNEGNRRFKLYGVTRMQQAFALAPEHLKLMFHSILEKKSCTPAEMLLAESIIGGAEEL